MADRRNGRHFSYQCAGTISSRRADRYVLFRCLRHRRTDAARRPDGRQRVAADAPTTFNVTEAIDVNRKRSVYCVTGAVVNQILLISLSTHALHRIP
jgi:hypothetical protein